MIRFTANQVSGFFTDINPQPWKIGPISVGRKGGKPFPIVAPDSTLVAYQNAIREEIEESLPKDFTRLEPDYRIRFWMWRTVECYKDRAGRTRWRNPADATNLQKATEDALRDLIIHDDIGVVDIHTQRVAQERGIPNALVFAVSGRGAPLDPPWDFVEEAGAYCSLQLRQTV